MNKTVEQIFEDANIEVTGGQLNAITQVLGKNTLSIDDYSTITADNAQNILKNATCWIIEDLGCYTINNYNKPRFYRLWLKVNGELIPITIEDLALMEFGTSDADDIGNMMSTHPLSASTIERLLNFQIDSSLPVIYIDRYLRYDYGNSSIIDADDNNTTQSVFYSVTSSYPKNGFLSAYNAYINVEPFTNENTNDIELRGGISAEFKFYGAPSSGAEKIFDPNFQFNIRDNIFCNVDPSVEIVPSL